MLTLTDGGQMYFTYNGSDIPKGIAIANYNTPDSLQFKTVEGRMLTIAVHFSKIKNATTDEFYTNIADVKAFVRNSANGFFKSPSSEETGPGDGGEVIVSLGEKVNVNKEGEYVTLVWSEAFAQKYPDGPKLLQLRERVNGNLILSDNQKPETVNGGPNWRFYVGNSDVTTYQITFI